HLELPAQPADGYIKGAVERIGAAPARPVEELVARKHAARPLDKAGQEIELGGGQGHARAIGPLDAAGIKVDDKARKAAPTPRARTRSRCLAAPQDRANARQELARIERLAKV